MNNIHEGHRNRQIEKFMTLGLDAFTDIETLELLLYFSIPRGDTNPIAHELLNTFGSFSGVLNADVEALMQVKGVGKHTATLIHMQLQLMRRYHINQTKQRESMWTVGKAERVVRAYLLGKQEESFYLFCLSTKKELINVVELQRGSVDSVSVYARHVLGAAINSHAAAVILGHNHPGGKSTPSREDVERTEELEALFWATGIELTDHIIISQNDFVSTNRAGILKRRIGKQTVNNVSEETVEYQTRYDPNELEPNVIDRSEEVRRQLRIK